MSAVLSIFYLKEKHFKNDNPSRNFEMAVSYSVTFPVMVLLLLIAFTGYLEVNKTINWISPNS